MTKQYVDKLINNMKLADMVSKTSEWSREGIRDTEMNIKYIGFKINGEWNEVIPQRNNILVKFIVNRKLALIELYLANQPPFIKITHIIFTQNDKWETIFGEIKRKLKRDKNDYLHHRDTLGNSYSKIKTALI